MTNCRNIAVGISVFFTTTLQALPNCRERQELVEMSTRAGLVPDVYARFENGWTESETVKALNPKQAELGLQYSLRDAYRSKVLREMADLECIVSSSEFSSNQLTEGLIHRAKVARLSAEIAELTSHLPRLESYAKIQRERYLGRTINVLEFDNALGRSQRYSRLLADRKQELALLHTSRDGSKDQDLTAIEQANQVHAAAQRYQDLSRSLASMNNWDVSGVFGRRSYFAAGNDDPQFGSFAAIQVKLNLGAPVQFFHTATPVGAPNDALQLHLAALNQATAANQDRLQVIQEALNHSSASRADADEKAMELFSRWLEIKVESAGLSAELASLKDAPKAPAKTTSNAGNDANTPQFVTVDEPTYRNAISASDGDFARLTFRVESETDKTRALGSGETRRQLGVMLRQSNQCNLVYAMLRWEDRKIVVQEKSNPKQSTHEECQNGGYSTIAPTTSAALPDLKPQQTYKLSTSIDKDQMTVKLDDTIVWQGSAPKIITSGANIGFRSDNLNVEYRLENIRD